MTRNDRLRAKRDKALTRLIERIRELYKTGADPEMIAHAENQRDTLLRRIAASTGPATSTARTTMRQNGKTNADDRFAQRAKEAENHRLNAWVLSTIEDYGK